VDIVVANNVMQKDSAFAEMTLQDWQTVLSTNLTGQFLTTQAAVREFRRRGHRGNSKALGKIICMSSVHEVIPWAGHVNYAASKGGIQMFMKSLAQEVAPERIRVNSIAPGAIRTPINKDAWNTEDALKKLLQLIPYGRVGDVEDIGNAAVWLASDESDYVVGTTLFVDGGMTLYPGFADNG
jgi:glucose 1-dehydrogenase